MCGRYVSATDADGLARFFVVDDRRTDPLPVRYNVAPTTPVYAVVRHEGRRVLVAFRWGLVPPWADDPRIGGRMINARAETVAEKPAFRDSFRRKRCLVPTDGFYEWKREPDGSKTPYYVRAADGDPLALAGLWAAWRDRGDPDAEALRTCTVVTTDANASLRSLHHRMPVVLPRDAWDEWLDPANDDVAALVHLLRPAPDDLLVASPVGDAVNNVRNDSPELLAPVGPSSTGDVDIPAFGGNPR